MTPRHSALLPRLARTRRLLRGAALCLAAAIAAPLAVPAHAEAPQVKTQVPGFYRYQHGAFEVTALYDGFIDLDPTLLKNTSQAEIQRLLAREFLAAPKMQTAVNAYLVNTGSKLVLVDAGAAKLFGPTLGFIVDNLRAAGYTPAQVDVVLLTHLHGDHANGLVGPDGKAVFPNAEVRLAQEESDFWLSQANADKAPEDFKPFFKMARDAAAPYQAAGKWKPFAGETELLPGVRAVAARGHTPGHGGYLFTSNGEKLLIWGDLVHNAAVQFARPTVAIEFDTDKTQAVRTRQKIFAYAAKEKLLVAGMHLPFPGIGHVRQDGKRYSWVPVEFGPLR